MVSRRTPTRNALGATMLYFVKLYCALESRNWLHIGIVMLSSFRHVVHVERHIAMPAPRARVMLEAATTEQPALPSHRLNTAALLVAGSCGRSIQNTWKVNWCVERYLAAERLHYTRNTILIRHCTIGSQLTKLYHTSAEHHKGHPSSPPLHLHFWTPQFTIESAQLH